MPTRIHVWSDYVCPFCLIADELIDRAIDGRSDVEVVHHPHELRPYPTPTLRPEDAYLPDIWQRVVYPMARRYGVAMSLPTVSPQPYTGPAFRGAQFAADHGVGDAYHRRLMSAFFQEDLDIGDRGVLARLAAEIGLDGTAYSAALDQPEYAERHRRASAESAQADIAVVPTILIGARRIEGVAAEGVIRRALDEAGA
ncbi:DsbA family oxidoreductase [Streptomonospora litoralis]|uniref:DSBA-like thioredoxin domain protein n=1 Tax=Streptomonospora litoralis TaxID=2498135 RepID=A0A4P6Q058_9ACTN|nr:DsbA family protein [Streptomonospora litoralis]QBI51887.1 DSBA-like thioredoxin domain protein [Streptomonospora litoralis]